MENGNLCPKCGRFIKVRNSQVKEDFKNLWTSIIFISVIEM
jgi:hypothetical protein